MDIEKKSPPWYVKVCRVGAPNDNWMYGYIILSLAFVPIGFFIEPFVKGMVLSIAGLLSALCYIPALVWLRKHDQFEKGM